MIAKLWQSSVNDELRKVKVLSQRETIEEK